jgi:uncharacterized surface protein with fasciclin (FAS1) repeats
MFTTTMFTKLALVSALVTSAFAQSSYFPGFIKALRDNGLTLAADLIAAGANSSVYDANGPTIATGTHTLFIPTNDAIINAPASVISDAPLEEQQKFYLYYFTSSGINPTDTSPDKLTIARTLLKDPPTVNLPGNQAQVIVLSEAPNGNLMVVDAAYNQNITSQASFKYENLQIEAIPAIFTVPRNFMATVAGIGDLTSVGALTDALDPNLPSVLGQIQGITAFAPVNSAITDEHASVSPADAKKILLNHIINGTVTYSPQMDNGMKLTTAGGGTLTITTNSSGIYVTAAKSTARIITSNILVSNGVIHLIDTVLQ